MFFWYVYLFLFWFFILGLRAVIMISTKFDKEIIIFALLSPWSILGFHAEKKYELSGLLRSQTTNTNSGAFAALTKQVTQVSDITTP